MAEAPAFELFGTAHLLALAMTLALAVAISRAPDAATTTPLAKLMAFVLLLIVLTKPPMYVLVYEQPWTRSLPLDLCRINELFCVYMLLARSYRMFEVAYFLAMAGSLSAMLTPDLLHGFPDPRFLLFFASHGLSILAVLYAIFAYGFRPTRRSLAVIIIFLGAYTLLMAGVNLVLDSNYLFLCAKPAGASPLDYLGPWPWYVLGLISIAVVACVVCYLPFAFINSKAKAR